jgi:hypothetical protein
MPNANIQTPHIYNSTLILCIIGLLCLILIIKTDSKNWFIRNINYILCFVFIALGILINSLIPRPLFYATSDHQLVAFNVDNKLQFNKARASKYYFAFDTWYEFNNEQAPTKNKRYKCDHGLCKFSTPKWNLVYIQNFTAIKDNIVDVCYDKSVDYIVSSFELNAPKCYGKILKNGLIIYPNGHMEKVINHRPWNK